MSQRSDPERLAAVMNALAERAAGATDQEIRDDAEAAGVDLRAQGARVRAALADAVLRAKKQRLLDAAEQHKRAVAALGQRTARLPVAPATRRALVARVIARRPETRQQVLTLQHREFEEFTDRDVDSVLPQLAALGLLDDELGEE
ncbi:MAG TPA: hypothetical protein VMJ10_17065 [Kofleriaceae bacterium]|nr:hypothetical protein [Kofleriaceae bacterium]